MTVIELAAGKKHTIRVGDNEKGITLRPGEVRYEPFLREVVDIPKVDITKLPEKPSRALPTRMTYEKWIIARPKPTFDDIITLVEGVRGRRDMGFMPTFDNLVSILKKYRK
jgi:hypothetical protein